MKIGLIVIGIIVFFFLGMYATKKQNENNIDEYFDERNRNL
ncbi:MAG: hypothetical protein AAF611_02550 [Bacteroidota bacterium]